MEIIGLYVHSVIITLKKLWNKDIDAMVPLGTARLSIFQLSWCNYLSSLLVGSRARRHDLPRKDSLDVHGYQKVGSLFEVKDGVILLHLLHQPRITRDAISV